MQLVGKFGLAITDEKSIKYHIERPQYKYIIEVKCMSSGAGGYKELDINTSLSFVFISSFLVF